MLAPGITLTPGFFGEKTCIISKSGYGKSYTARVVIEEGLKLGHTFLVFDPQDAYSNLPGFVYIRAEGIKKPKELGKLLAQTNKNTVVITKRLTIEKQEQILKDILSEFCRFARKGIQTVIIDEMHKYAPEGHNTICKETIQGMFQEKRSDGIGCIAVEQRPQRLDKTVLSQADHFALGRVTSYRDKEAVKNYLDDQNDIEKIAKLEKGEFFLVNFGSEQPRIAKIRPAETKHSGNSPTNVLTEDKIKFSKSLNSIVDNRFMTADGITTEIGKIVPSKDTFIDMAKLGAKVSLGLGLSAGVSTLIGSRIKPIGPISGRTIGSGATTVILYTGYRMSPIGKDVLKYATAGSAVYTFGSLTFDILNAMNIQLPWAFNWAITNTTGVQNASQAQGNQEQYDLNTAFAS